jgi:hypothetical protein
MKKDAQDLLGMILFWVAFIGYFVGMVFWNMSAWAGKATLLTIQIMPWWIYTGVMLIVGLFAWIYIIPDPTKKVSKKTKPKAIRHVLIQMISSAGIVFGHACGSSLSMRHGLNLFIDMKSVNPSGSALFFSFIALVLSFAGYVIVLLIATKIANLITGIVTYLRKKFTKKNKVSELTAHE